MIRTDRTGFRGNLRFALAYDFLQENGERYDYAKHPLEKLGGVFRAFQGGVLHTTFRVIRSPIGWGGIIATAALAYSIVLYPKQSHTFITTIFPPAGHIRAWMFKSALFILGEAMILGTGLRFIGRCRNQALRTAWQRGEIDYIYIGASSRK